MKNSKQHPLYTTRSTNPVPIQFNLLSNPTLQQNKTLQLSLLTVTVTLSLSLMFSLILTFEKFTDFQNSQTPKNRVSEIH